MLRRFVIASAGLVAMLPGLPAGTAAAAPLAPAVASVPAEFTSSRVSGSVSTPVSVTGLPDGRVVVLEKGGAVRVVVDGAFLPGSALTLTVCTQSERGLLGFATDPQFMANGAVYVYYTRPSASALGGCVNRVSRFSMSGNSISPASEVVLLDNIGSPAGNHNGGDLEIGNDGYLYIGVGDGGCNPRDAGQSQCAGGNGAAQDVSLLNGKILRVDRNTGAPAPGNPFTGAGTTECRTRGNGPSTPTTKCREIYAYGLRNPWRFAFDQNTGATRFFINDVGQNTREEIDLGQVGANYGWPVREGNCAQGATPLACGSNPPEYATALLDYTHASGEGEYITGAAFVPDGVWDAAFDGAYLYSDGNPGRIYVRYSNGSHAPFATGLQGISDIGFVMEPGGWVLYYVNPATNEVGRIVYNTVPSTTPETLAFTPVAPSQRAFDSRNAGADTGPLRAGTTRLVNLVATQGAHRAVLANVTFVDPGSSGYLALWKPRTTRPDTSNANGDLGQVAANASILPIDADGNVLLFSISTSHVIIDVLGFWDALPGTTATAGRLVTVSPVRAVDTRHVAGASNLYSTTSAPPFRVVNAPLAGRFGLGASSSAVALIVTGVSSTVGGYVTVMPHGGVTPPSSNLNVNGTDDVRANLVIVPVGADGSVDLRLYGVQDVIVDVVGWFTDGTAPDDASGTFRLTAPTRVADTRWNLGFARLAAGGIVSLNPTVVPDAAIAVAQNMVMVNPAGYGYLTAYPTGLPSVPIVSNDNTTAAGQVRAAMALTSLGAGSSSYYSFGATDVIVDVVGYFDQGAG